MGGAQFLSGERTRLACWLRRLAATRFCSGQARSVKSSRRRGCLRQHARHVRSPIYEASRSFESECDHRVDFCCSAAGDISGNERNRCQQQRDGEKGGWIV